MDPGKEQRVDPLADRIIGEIVRSRKGGNLDPSKVSELCRLINQGKIGGGRVAMRAMKNCIISKDPKVQLHALTLLEALLSNCKNVIHDIASEHVIDDIASVADDGLVPGVNQEKATKLVKQLAEHIQAPSLFKEIYERLLSKGVNFGKNTSKSSLLAVSTHPSGNMGFQQTCRNRVQGLLKDLASSSEYEAHHIQKWLEAFSERLMNRSDEVTAQVLKLVESTGVVEQELYNTFNTFRGLSSSQFVENRVYEEDETVFANEDMKIKEQGMPSQSYEDDIIPRYREAVATAWNVYEQHICKPYMRASSYHKSRMLGERWHKQLPHIIGTEDFMRDNSCGLAEDRTVDAFDFESDAERDGANMAAEMADTKILPEGEWSGSESDVSDEQVGSFKPSVSAALDFKAMLEAALRSPYIPYKGDVLPGDADSTTTSVNMMSTLAKIQRNVSKEVHDALRSDSSTESQERARVSTLMEDDSKVLMPSLSSLAQRNPEVLQSNSQHIETQKVKSSKELGLEKESTSMKLNDVLNALHTPMMAGGLFDDEYEDGDLFRSQSAVTESNIWSKPAIPDDLFTNAGIHVRKENEGSVPESDKQQSNLKTLSSPKKSSSSHSDRTFLSNRSYEHVHDPLFVHGSDSGLPLKDTLSFLRKGLFDDEEADDRDLFGPSNGVGTGGSLKEILGSKLEDLKGETKGGNTNRDGLKEDTRAGAVNEFSENTSFVRGVSQDLGNEAISSMIPGSLTVDMRKESTNKDGCESQPHQSTEDNAFSALEPLSEKDTGIVPMTDGVAQIEDKSWLLLGSDDNTNIENVGTAESDDDMNSWSSANSSTDTLNIKQSIVEASSSSGVKPEETQQQAGHHEGLAEHLKHHVGQIESKAISDSGQFESFTDIVEQQHEGEDEKITIGYMEAPIPETIPPVQEVKEEPPKVSSSWSRKITSLQERLSLQPSMFSFQHAAPNALVVDASEGDNRSRILQTQRPSLQATLQGGFEASHDTNHLHHATMSRPRGPPKRRAPTSSRQGALPLFTTHTQQIVVGVSQEEEWAGKGPDISDSKTKVQEDHNLGEKTELPPRGDGVFLASSTANKASTVDGNAVTKSSHSDNTFSSTRLEDRKFAKSEKKTTEVGFVDKSEAQKPQVAFLNSLLFEDGNDKDNLFGPLQGMAYSNFSDSTSLLKNQGYHSPPDKYKGISKTESKAGLKGEDSKVSDHTFQERSSLEHSRTLSESIKKSLFDDDDDDENDLFS